MANKINITTNKSEDISQLSKSLVSFQDEMKILETPEPENNINLREINDCLSILKPLLKKNDLIITQLPEVDKKAISIKTVLTHRSGEWKSITVEIPLSHGTKTVPYPPQSRESIITYAKRCGLRKILNMYV